MSRDPKPDEITSFQKKFGYKPTVIATSLDMLAFYVHKDNPIARLSLKQLDGTVNAEFRPLVADRRGDILLAQGKKDEAIAAYRSAWAAMDAKVAHRLRSVGGREPQPRSIGGCGPGDRDVPT